MPEWATSWYWMQRESRLTVAFSRENICFSLLDFQLEPILVSFWVLRIVCEQTNLNDTSDVGADRYQWGCDCFQIEKWL